MNLKDKLTKPLYQKSFDGDSYHTYILFENMDVILEEQTKIAKEYTKLKCQELLKIVADRAKIIDEDGDVYEQPHIFFCNGEGYKNWVDKDSILNAVDLDIFII